MSLPTLLQIPYSPWSLKARLALRVSGIAFQTKLYLPMIGELALRWRLRRLSGPVSVPVLLTDQGVVSDSYRIARLALAGGPWWPEDPAIDAWNRWSERMLALGRLRTTMRVRRDPKALVASLPSGLAGLGPLSRLIGELGTIHLIRRYGLGLDEAAIEREMDGLLDQCGGALMGRDHLLEGPSYADIAVAVGLSFIDPPASLPISSLARPHWRVPALAERYAPLLSWRDRVLAAVDAAAPPSA